MLIVCGTVIGAAILIITASYFIIGNNGDSDWAKDAADRLDGSGGSVYMTDGSCIVIYAHLKPTTHVEYRNSAFYITDPNNSFTGLAVVPLDNVAKIYTAV